MTIIKSTIAAVAICAAFSIYSSANAQTSSLSNPTGVVANFDLPGLEALLTEMGAPYERRVSDGKSYLVVSEAVILNPFACSGENYTSCAGLQVYATTSKVISAGVANELNKNGPLPASILAFEDSTMVFRYLIADHGFTRGSFDVDLQVFYTILNNVASVLSSYSNTIAFDPLDPERPAAPANVAPGKPMPGDNAASDLNARQKIANDATRKTAPMAVQNVTFVKGSINDFLPIHRTHHFGE